jgi:hypothetical protein
MFPKLIDPWFEFLIDIGLAILAFLRRIGRIQSSRMSGAV